MTATLDAAETLGKVPALRRGYRFQWEPAQNGHVLLYPEGMIKLNDSASEIFKLIDGQQSVAAIITTLSQRFPDAADIDQDILAFMEVASAQFWIDLR